MSNSKRRQRERRWNWSNLQFGAPRVTVVHLPADYELTAEDRAAAAAGRVIFIHGPALAKAARIVKWIGNLEAAWYWLSAVDEPYVIVDLYLPDVQEVTACHVQIPPEAVTAANVAVRRQGRIITGAGHSHHSMGASTSGTDEELMDRLACEGVGFRSIINESVSGSVKPQPDAAPAETIEAGSTFQVLFGERPGVTASISVAAGLPPEEIQVELVGRRRRLLSLFSTHDVWGTLHFPLFDVTWCEYCGNRTKEKLLAPAAVRVLGPIELSEEEHRELLAEWERKAPRRPAWQVAYVENNQQHDDPSNRAIASRADEEETPADDGREDQRPAAFEVRRHGRQVAMIDAATLEEAAFKCPALARQLGWIEEEAEAESHPATGAARPPD